MEVSYTWTRQDAIRQAPMLVLAAPIGVLFGACSAWFAFNVGLLEEPWRILEQEWRGRRTPWLILAITQAWIAWFLLAGYLQLRRQARAEVGATTHVRVSDEGIEVINDGGERRYAPWHRIESVRIARDQCAVVLMGGRTGVSVPARAFPDRASRNAFAAVLKEGIRRGGPSAAAGARGSVEGSRHS